MTRDRTPSTLSKALHSIKNNNSNVVVMLRPRIHERKVTLIGSICSQWLTSLWSEPLNAHTDYGGCNEMS